MASFTVLPELIIPDKRLGRHIDRPEGFSLRTPATTVPKSVLWTRHCGPYNQGNVGSCTGNAGVGTLMSDPFWVPGRNFNETNAVNIYEDATRYSSTPELGYYKPNDVGSSGPAVAQALENHKPTKLITSYGHVTNLEDALGAMVLAPGIFGINWYSSFDNPTLTGANAGECPLSADAYIRGGHEIEGFQVDLENERLWFWNSWGEDWGQDGKFFLSFGTLNTLFSQGADGTFFLVTH